MGWVIEATVSTVPEAEMVKEEGEEGTRDRYCYLLLVYERKKRMN